MHRYLLLLVLACAPASDGAVLDSGRVDPTLTADLAAAADTSPLPDYARAGILEALAAGAACDDSVAAHVGRPVPELRDARDASVIPDTGIYVAPRSRSYWYQHRGRAYTCLAVYEPDGQWRAATVH